MLSLDEIKRFIEEDRISEQKRLANVGQRYYEGQHDILQHRLFYFNDDGKLVEDTMRSNIKISHPFFTELTDQLSSYMMSFKENPIQAKEGVDGLQEHLDHYFNDEFWSEVGELIVDTYSKGFGYMYGLNDAEGKIQFKCADTMGVVEVREKDSDDKCQYIIYWYIDRIGKGRKSVKRIQVWTAKETHYFVQVGKSGKVQKDDSVSVNPRPHVVYTDKETGKKMGYSFGFIPFWRMDNNRKQFSGLKPIKALIDDYDLMECALSNNLTDFDTPLHVVSGFKGDNLDKLQTNLKTKKLVGVGQGGSIDVKTVDIPYQARKVKADEDEKNIYRFGMGLNTQGLKDTTATTNIAIKTAYALLDMKANKMEVKLKALLKKLLKVVLDEINENEGKKYQLKDVDIWFERSVMTNETENIQNAKTEAETKQLEVNTILNVAMNVGDEQTLKAICDVMEWDFKELKKAVDKANEEQSLIEAQKTLEGVVVDNELN